MNDVLILHSYLCSSHFLLRFMSLYRINYHRTTMEILLDVSMYSLIFLTCVTLKSQH